MECSSIRDRLPAAVLGELGHDERREVHRHLSDCAVCLHEEMSLQESMRLLRLQDEQEAPDLQIHDAVMARVSAATGRQEKFRAPAKQRLRRSTDRFSRTLLTAAATALFVVGLQTVLETWRPGEGPPSPAEIQDVEDRRRLQRNTGHYLKGTAFEQERGWPLDRLRHQRKALRDARLNDIQS